MSLHNNITPQVAGEKIINDPNHPVEVYYGGPLFSDIVGMANDLGVIIFPEDKVETVPDPSMGLGSQISIIRATKVDVTDAKVKTTYRTWQTTIADLIKEKKIDLLGQDSVSPDINTKLTYGMNITITRVAEVEVTEKELIEYKVIKKNDNTLEKGNKEITQKGINGEKEIIYTVKRVDGEEVSRVVKNTNIVKQAQDEIQVIGTKVVVYGSGTATWYGRRQSMVAASNTIPKGTRVHVVALGSGKSVDVLVDDTGIQSNAIIDLSSDAFAALASLGTGVITVRVEKYYP